MSHERPDAPHPSARRPDHATDTDRQRTVQPETGSVWWAELGLGVVCSLTATLVFLAKTAVGPFESLTITYGPTLTLAYLGVALVIGLGFVASGLLSSPYLGDSAVSDDEAVQPDEDA